MVPANQLCLNGFSYKRQVLIVKNVIDFFVAVSLLLPQFLALTVSPLQFLQPEPYTTNSGFIKLLISELGLGVISKTLELWQSVGFGDEDLVLGQEVRKRGIKT